MDPYTFSKTGMSICIYSYNSRGFAQEKQDLLKILMSSSGRTYPIICNQENFMLRANSYKIKNCLTGAHVMVKGAVKNSHDNGRPKNGMFIAVPAEIKESVRDISPDHWRVQAAIVHTTGNNILIVNTYFPTDPQVSDFDSSELLTTLSSIQDLLQRNDYNSVVWTGDINADFCRNNGFTKYIQSFIEENNLTEAWKKFPVDFTHVQEQNGKSSTSTLDHFMLSENIVDAVTDAGVLHLVNNFSDHCPIYCQISINGIEKLPSVPTNCIPKPSWKNATEQQKNDYKSHLQKALEDLKFDKKAICCQYAHCADTNHIHACDDLITNILKTIDKSSAKHLTQKPTNKKTRENPIAFWEQEVEPFKKNAQFWHSVWVSAGKPINTELHKIMKRTRNIYHLQIRKCKKAANTLKRNALLDACLNGKGDIFTEIRKIRRSPMAVANSIDGVTENIPTHFATIYSKLFNSVDEKASLDQLYNHINANIDDQSLTEILKITPKIVYDATQHLKKSKNDPTFRFNSDCLTNAPPILFEQLALIFQFYLFHGHMTDVLLLSTLVPLVKDKLGNLCSSDNYRSIAISSLILKIFDWVMILLFGEKLHLDALQFGYQENCSTNMCTWMAVETIDHFMRNGSDVFVCVMDLKKAFDTVQHSVLFWKLLKRGIPFTYVRLLMTMYAKQFANVKWNNVCSTNFPIRNGVKQGAVLSAILFCIYIDDLFSVLRKSRSGCWINDQFYGMLGYADDIMLISPTHDGLQEMVNTCATFMSSHNLTFSTNPDPKKCKTKCLAFTKRSRELTSIQLNGNDLPWVTSAKHLGTKVENCLNGVVQDLMEKRAIFINRNNELRQEFHFAHPRTLIRTNNIFNTSMYGCMLWDLFGKEAQRLEKTWNISQRLMLGLHRETHCYLIEPISETKHIIMHLYKRFVSFINSVMKNKKLPLQLLCDVISNDCRSTTGGNLRRLMIRCGAGSFKELIQYRWQNDEYMKTEDINLWKIEAIKDLIEARYDDDVLPRFTKNEVNSIVDYLSTC